MVSDSNNNIPSNRAFLIPFSPFFTESKFECEIKQCRNQQFQLQRADTTKQQGRNAFYEAAKRRLHDEIYHCTKAAHASRGKSSQYVGEDCLDAHADPRCKSGREQSVLIA